MRHTFILAAVTATALAALIVAPTAVANHDSQSGARIHPDGTDNNDSVASWGPKCDYLGMKHLDPIKHHNESAGQGASDHDHIYFGGLTDATDIHGSHPNQFGGDDVTGVTNYIDNDWLRARAAEQDLEPGHEQENYACQIPDSHVHCGPLGSQGQLHPCLDGSLYWFPALYVNKAERDAGHQAQAAWMFPYYRNEKVNPNPASEGSGGGNGNMHPMPDYLSMVGGNGEATSGQGIATVEWSCIQGTDAQGSLLTPYTDYIPDTCTYDNTQNLAYLRVVVHFPGCIPNGEPNYQVFHNYTPDMRYVIPNPISGAPWAQVCPSGYYPIPQLSAGFRWRLDGGPFPCDSPVGIHVTCHLENAQLASDPQNPTDHQRGMTAHADFMSGWTHDDMAYLMKQCFYNYPLSYPDKNFNVNCGVV